MKFKFDRKYLKICLYAFFTVAALLLVYRLLQSSDDVWKSVMSSVSFLLRLLSPFIAAILIAYILNPAVKGIETVLGKIFKKNGLTKGKKLLSLCIVYAVTVTVIAVTLYYIIPGIVRNMGDLVRNMPRYFMRLQEYYTNTILPYPLFSSDAVQNAISAQIEHFMANLTSTLATIISGVTRFIFSTISFVLSAVIGLILSFYLLNERENIVASCSRLLHARLGEKRSASVMGFLNSVDRVFGRYISAKLLICFIMFALSFTVFGIIGVPYVVLMAAIVALSTLVPYIGPFVGAVPPIVISLLVSPQMALYAGISLLVMHLLDGYVIEPFVFSGKMGLSPFWILLSIILGGGLFGLWGMLLAVPVAAVVKLLIAGYIKSRQQRRSSGPQGEGGGPAQ